MDKEISQEKHSQEQPNNRPWLFQPGKSGNPGGRPKGSKSLKTYAMEMLREMSDEEKLEYLKGLDKKVIWEMSEGKPKQDLDVNAEVTTKIISIDE